MEGGDANKIFYDMVRMPFSRELDSKGITQCDKLAVDPNDPKKKISGWNIAEDYEQKRFNNAMEACIAAVGYNPKFARENFQLARLINFLGDKDRTKQFNNVAVNLNYAPATNMKAEMLITSSDDHNTREFNFQVHHSLSCKPSPISALGSTVSEAWIQ